MLPGQTLDRWTAAGPALCHALGLTDIRFVPVAPSRWRRNRALLNVTGLHADVLADLPTSLVAVKGYSGDPDAVLHDIMQRRIVMLHGDGGVEIIAKAPETQSVETMLQRIRRDIFSFGAGVDGQDDGQNNRSGAALMHKRSDMDVVCNNFEVELQDAMQQILWFAKQYWANIGAGDFLDQPVKVVFNRDIIISETETIQNLKNSVGMISERTIISNHPYVDDVDKEIEAMSAEENDDQAKFLAQQRLDRNTPITADPQFGGVMDGSQQQQQRAPQDRA